VKNHITEKSKKDSLTITDYRVTHPHYNLKFLLIDRKADIISFISFSITSFNLLVLGFLVFDEADIIQQNPKSIILWGYENQSGGRYLSINADLAYINKSNKTQNAVLKNEAVIVEKVKCSSGRLIIYNKKLDAAYYENMIIGSSEIKRVISEYAVPIDIPGLSVKTHGTSFFPFENDCRDKNNCEIFDNWISVKKFTDELNSCFPTESQKDETISLFIKFQSEYYSSSPTSTICELLIGKSDIAHLNDENRRIKTSGISDGVVHRSFGFMNRTCFPLKERKNLLNIFDSLKSTS
jgi:hypothetical protein